jgi:hypothetical protein
MSLTLKFVRSFDEMNKFERIKKFFYEFYQLNSLNMVIVNSIFFNSAD